MWSKLTGKEISQYKESEGDPDKDGDPTQKQNDPNFNNDKKEGIKRDFD